MCECLCVSLCLRMLRDLWIYVFDCVCLHLNLRVPPTHSGTLPHIRCTLRGGPEDRRPSNGSITREAGGGTLKVIMVESSSDSSLPLCARCFQRSAADTVPKTKCYSGHHLVVPLQLPEESVSTTGSGRPHGPSDNDKVTTSGETRRLKSPGPLSTTIPCHTRVQVRGGIATAWMSAQEPLITALNPRAGLDSSTYSSIPLLTKSPAPKM